MASKEARSLREKKMHNSVSLWLHQGFVHLPGILEESAFARIDQTCVSLSEHANRLLANAQPDRSGVASSTRVHSSGLIVVPETSDPGQVCRFEYLAGCSEYFRKELVPRLANLIAEAAGHRVILFKDKCNMKRPNGGAFGPHQDIVAYQHFGPRTHITAAVPVDSATELNGCLEMAVDYYDFRRNATWLSINDTPILPHYSGGLRNGEICSEIVERLAWLPIEATPGDIILFDSFVPHRSQRNRSSFNRRLLFFTFNLAAEGDHYEAYYRAKRTDPDHAMFHVSTPTDFRRSSTINDDSLEKSGPQWS